MDSINVETFNKSVSWLIEYKSVIGPLLLLLQVLFLDLFLV
jgi:hypothetical protein